MMKLVRVSLLFFCLLTACKKQQSQFNKETSPITSPENPTSNDRYRIGNSSVGVFKLGDSLPNFSSYQGYAISKKEVVKNSEGTEIKMWVYTVSDDDDTELLQLRPSYQDKDLIGEIMILSPLFKTPKNIGVGSDLNSFFEAYPDGILWYTYISDRFVVETEQLEAQFLLDGEGFTGKVSPNDEVTTLKRTTFKPETPIRRIRLWKVQHYMD